MFAKFVSLLLLLVIIVALIYVAIADVNIPQKERVINIKPEIVQVTAENDAEQTTNAASTPESDQ